ncbi:MAG TPA: hypothetical protein VN039_03320 [Nitrospira sp.]|nr:hypothetical protein [Nitrospira sp.]
MDDGKHSHYKKDVEHLHMVDVYRVLALYDVTDPALQHAIKKLLVAGGRGAGKDVSQDIQEAIDSLERWKDMQMENELRGRLVLNTVITKEVRCEKGILRSVMPEGIPVRRTNKGRAEAARKRKGKSR